jgi:hypothetical protein
LLVLLLRLLFLGFLLRRLFLALSLFPLPLLLLEFLLIDAGEDGAGEGQIVLGVGVGRIAAQDLFVGLGGPGEIAELEARITQVVGGIIRQLRFLIVGKGVGGLGMASCPIEGDALAVGIGKTLGRTGVIALLEPRLGLLLRVVKPAGLGRRGQDQGHQPKSHALHDLRLQPPRPRNRGSSRTMPSSRGR